MSSSMWAIVGDVDSSMWTAIVQRRSKCARMSAAGVAGGGRWKWRKAPLRQRCPGGELPFAGGDADRELCGVRQGECIAHRGASPLLRQDQGESGCRTEIVE